MSTTISCEQVQGNGYNKYGMSTTVSWEREKTQISKI
jgi:hypothetical protein